MEHRVRCYLGGRRHFHWGGDSLRQKRY